MDAAADFDGVHRAYKVRKPWDLDPWQVTLVYAGAVLLVYLGTDGFHINCPFIFTIPPLLLAAMNSSKRLPRKKRVLTSLSFVTLAAGLYNLSYHPNELRRSALLITLSHGFYFATFYSAIRRWWASLAVVILAAVACFEFWLFGDLWRDMQVVISAFSLMLFVNAVTFIGAGSLWKYGGKLCYEDTKYDLVRWLGLLLTLACKAALLINLFIKDTSRMDPLVNTIYYASQFALYYANEREF